MSRPRSKTRKVFHQISNVLSSPVSSLKMEEPFPITTSKRNQPFTWSSVFVVVCKSSSRHSLERQSLWKLKLLTPSKMSKLKFRTKKVFHQTSNVLSSLVNNLKTEELFLIIISRRNQLFISSFVFVVVCKSLSKHWLEKPSPSKSRPLTPSKMSKPRFKIKKVSHQISNVSFSPESNLKMAVHSPITTSRRNRHFISSFDFGAVCKSSSRP